MVVLAPAVDSMAVSALLQPCNRSIKPSMAKIAKGLGGASVVGAGDGEGGNYCEVKGLVTRTPVFLKSFRFRDTTVKS